MGHNKAVFLAAKSDLGIDVSEAFILGAESIERKGVLLIQSHDRAVGMVVAEEMDQIRDLLPLIQREGFGYSVLCYRSGDNYCRTAFKEMLDDWGIATDV